MKVYEAVARALKDEGVEKIFALVGNANMELLTAFADGGSGKIYAANIEGTAVGMAEGFARSTNRVGVCSVTSGPGLTNTLTALTSAARASTPLVLITGHPSDPDNHQRTDQHAVATLAGAGYREIETSGSALDDVRAVFWLARTEGQPMVLDIGRAVQAEEYPWEYAYSASSEALPLPQRIQPDPEALERAVALLANAERPVVVAGAGAIRSGARRAALDLAGDIGALLSTSLHAKNAFSGDPFNIGVSGLFSWKFTMELLAQSDCIIAAGASLNHYTTEGGYLFPEAKVIQIDTRPFVLTGMGRAADAFVRADAQAGLELLRAMVKDRRLEGTRFRTDKVREFISSGLSNLDPAEFDLQPGLGDPRKLCAVIDEMFPEECGIVVGTGHAWGFPNTILRKWRTPQLYSHAFGSIGIAFPLAIGAAIGNPDRPLVFIDGDGSTMMNIHAFNTMARYQLPIFMTVLNDSAYGSEYHQFGAKGIDPALSLLPEVSFAAVAGALGCHAAEVRTAEEMKTAAGDFLANPRPYVVDARVSRQVVSTAVRRLHYGLES